MAYRPQPNSYGQDDGGYELQSRYSQQFDRAPASPASPNSPPGLLRDQQAHARYSSADLYALEQTTHSHTSGSGLLAHQESTLGAHTDDEDEDDGAGFTSYRDLTPAGARRSARYSQAPPLVSNPSATSTYMGYDPHGSRDALASTAKFGGETIDAPVLSRADWTPGEAVREKHEYSTEKKRRKRQAIAGEVKDVGKGVGGFLRRNWRWVAPLFVFLCVAAIVLCYFLIPRTPTIAFNSPLVPKPAFTSSDTEPYVSSAEPTSFKFDGSIILALDASDSYLPVTYRSFGLTVRLQETEGIIAQETWSNGEISVPARKATSYEFPITFHGNYTSASNPTYAAVRAACAHKYATIYRPPLNLTVTVSSSITGVVNAPDRTAKLNAVACPVEWASTAS
ncbi:hypothetical protein JCM10449v2_006374 [Rhodotorula kratochvilovae]